MSVFDIAQIIQLLLCKKRYSGLFDSLQICGFTSSQIGAFTHRESRLFADFDFTFHALTQIDIDEPIPENVALCAVEHFTPQARRGLLLRLGIRRRSAVVGEL